MRSATIETDSSVVAGNGTLSLYAALDVKTGKVQGKTAERHTMSGPELTTLAYQTLDIAVRGA